MKNAHIQRLSFLGIPYIRIFTESADASEIEDLKKEYSYIALYSYTKIPVRGFWLTVQKTPVIDLSLSLEDILRGFRRDTRAGIKRSEKIEGIHFEIPADDSDQSYAFYKRIKQKDGVHPDLQREFTDCIFFNVYMHGYLVVSLSFYDNGVTLRSKHIVSLRKEMGRDHTITAHATRALLWQICKWAKEKGYKKIDLGGVNFSDPAKKNIAEFKLSFSENVQEIYIYRYQTKLFSFIKKILNLLGKNIH